MRLRDYILDVAPKIIPYELARKGKDFYTNPLTITFSVTAACRSLCKTCNIGRVYLENPERAERDLSLAEIEKTFKSLGEIYFFNVSGGEPFMRLDLAEILRLAFIHLKPKLISIPTNSLAPKQVEKTTLKILEYMNKYLPKHVPLSIKPSIDGVGEMHDYVRGINGNFVRLEETIDRLLAIRKRNPRLHVDLGTVISNYNISHLPELEAWVHKRGIESYRHEVAEQRVEFHNIGDPITPSAEVYTQLTKEFANKVISNIKGKRLHTKITESIRIAYYKVASEILEKQKQVTPCYGGLSNIHLDYDGEIWPCCILGGEHSMGNIRDWDYDIISLLKSEQAKSVVKYIADGNCACPLASQWLNNILLTPSQMLKAIKTLFITFPFGIKEKIDNKYTLNEAKCDAIVVQKAGTIPTAKEIEAKVLEKNDDAFLTVASKEINEPFKVKSIEHLSEEYYLLTIDRHKLDFIPGQYFIVGKKNEKAAREYTIYSSLADDHLSFLIRKVEGGEVSNALSNVEVGEELFVEGPLGYFHLKDKDKENIFIATGAGISPFHSIVTSYNDLNYKVLHGIKYQSEKYHLDDYDRNRFISCTSRDDLGDFKGRVTDYLKSKTIDKEADYYICGNIDMLYEVYEILISKGINGMNIHAEVFY